MKKTGVALAALLLQQYASAQTIDTTKKTPSSFTIGGSADLYYRYNFNSPKTAPFNSPTSFTRSSNSFELGMASIRADHNFGKASVTVDLGFGKRAEEFAYNDGGTRFAIKQLYVAYAPSPGIKFTLGSWATHIGYELQDAYLNRNYSMSYMFTNGPFSHTGIKTDIKLGGKSSLMLGISNPTDYRSAPGMPKSFIAQFSTASNDDKLKASLNFVAGKQSTYKKVVQPDLVAFYAVSSSFSLGFNATMQLVQLDSTGHLISYKWWGAALYVSADPLNWFGLTLRTEYIGDKDNYLNLNHVLAPTLSANFKTGNLTIIPELRFDHAGNGVFYTDVSQATKSTSSFILAAAYHF